MSLIPPDVKVVYLSRSDDELLGPALEVIGQLRKDIGELSQTIAYLQEANTREVERRRRAEALVDGIRRYASAPRVLCKNVVEFIDEKRKDWK